MEPAVCWARENNGPLFIGEFGLQIGDHDESTRLAWTEAVARLAEAEGISWTYFHLAADRFGVWDGDVRSTFLRDDSPVQICNFGFFGIRPSLATCLKQIKRFFDPWW